MQELGKILIVFGLVVACAGFVVLYVHKVPFLGRLPGDVYIQKKSFTFYFPLATSLLVSVLLSFFFWLFNRR